MPTNIPGVIIECGCYVGGSTAKFSLIAKASGRQLVVFDSFRGLPVEHEVPEYYNFLDDAVVEFQQGDYEAPINAVKRNVNTYGAGEIVSYVPGYFQETMPGWHGEIAAVILDVDLVESTKTAIFNLWPQLSVGGYLFSQDANLEPIVGLFEDAAFWKQVAGVSPPYFRGLRKNKMVYAQKIAP